MALARDVTYVSLSNEEVNLLLIVVCDGPVWVSGPKSGIIVE